MIGFSVIFPIIYLTEPGPSQDLTQEKPQMSQNEPNSDQISRYYAERYILWSHNLEEEQN